MHHNKVFLYYISIATKHTQPKSKSSFQKSKTHQNKHSHIGCYNEGVFNYPKIRNMMKTFWTEPWESTSGCNCLSFCTSNNSFDGWAKLTVTCIGCSMICGFEHFFFSIFLTWHVLTQWLYEFIMRSSFHILDMVNLDPYFQKLCLLQFFIKVLQITTLAKLFEVYLHFSYHHDTSSAIIHFSTKIIGCQMSKIMSVFLPGFEKWIYTPLRLLLKSVQNKFHHYSSQEPNQNWFVIIGEMQIGGFASLNLAPWRLWMPNPCFWCYAHS